MVSRRTILCVTAGITPLVAGCTSATDEDDDPTESDTTDNPASEEHLNESDSQDEPNVNTDEGESEVETTTILISDQTSREQLLVEKIETNVDALLKITDSEGNSLAPAILVEGDEVLEEYTIQYANPVEQQQSITVRLVSDDDGELASRTITVRPQITDLVQGEIMLVEPEPNQDFNWPYFAYVPDNLRASGPVFVEPNNTGTSTDDFQKHTKRAKELLEQNSYNRKIPEKMEVPFLVPVFPRPREEPVNWKHYTQALDAESMAIEEGELERIDLQLIEMVDHFRASLKETIGYQPNEEFHLNGFSASGNFVNRFTALHPDRVQAVTAGGINGTLILPRDTIDGQSLPYPIGIDDVDVLTGDSFNKDAWEDVPQFIYLGSDDENDTIPYSDAWNDKLRKIALDIYGENMQKDRMPTCESIYNDASANSQFHIYQGVGHTIPRWVWRDIYEFHLQHIDPSNSFTPITIRKASDLDISFVTRPEGGDTEISVEIVIPEEYKIGHKFSDGSVSVMLDTGEEIEWRDRITLEGDRHLRPQDFPVKDTFTYSIEEPLESGEVITIGLMDGSIITSETVYVG